MKTFLRHFLSFYMKIYYRNSSEKKPSHLKTKLLYFLQWIGYNMKLSLERYITYLMCSLVLNMISCSSREIFHSFEFWMVKGMDGMCFVGSSKLRECYYVKRVSIFMYHH